ncbi:MAG: hypothetical protein R2695_14920 [Acidimicrobiales bacterium]
MRSFTAAELAAMDNALVRPRLLELPRPSRRRLPLPGIRTGAVPPPAGFTADDFAIPTLDQVVEAFPHRLLDIEIKDGPDGFAAAEALAAFIRSHGPADRYLIAPFDDAIWPTSSRSLPTSRRRPGSAR